MEYPLALLNVDTTPYPFHVDQQGNAVLVGQVLGKAAEISFESFEVHSVAPTYREVIGANDNRAAIHLGQPGDVRGRCGFQRFAVGVVAAIDRKGADLSKRAGVGQLIQTFSGHPASTRPLSGNRRFATVFLCSRSACFQLLAGFGPGKLGHWFCLMAGTDTK